jgi:putative adenylate-forming enzyme
MLQLLRVLRAYFDAKDLDRTFKSREQLEAYQGKKLRAFLHWLTNHSQYFSTYRRIGLSKEIGVYPLSKFPLMNKEVMMRHFDEMSTVPLPVSTIMNVARDAEATRDFQATIDGYTVGLSSGTSATRGAFIVSPKEKAQWAGTILAKLLPDGLFAGERVALFLRADSGLYQTVDSPFLKFRFFDLLTDFQQNSLAVAEYRPTILVAPAQVLRQLALEVMHEGLQLTPKRVVSVAEVLEPQDKELLERVFGDVHQVYQATEGFLASTCEHGTLHLNEEYLHVEKEWQDEEHRRFVPIITDFTRNTQPIVRYRLNDVLVAKKYPCKCGRVTQAIEAIEGRCDDMLLLRKWSGDEQPVFADAISRILAQALPLQADYRLTQVNDNSLKLVADVPKEDLPAIRSALSAGLEKLGVETAVLNWDLSNVMPEFNPIIKRRRITRLATTA